MLSRSVLTWSSSVMGSLARAASAIGSQHTLLPSTSSIATRHQSSPAATAAPDAPRPEAGPSGPPPKKHSPAGRSSSSSSSSRRPSHVEMPTPDNTRKPAILKPAPHQWRLCSPSYNPSEPPPSQYLPPYAPERAKRTNYRAIMHEYMPTSFNRNRHRRAHKHKMLVAVNAWRRKYEHSAAAAAKQQKYAKAVEQHVRREEAWRLWCRQHPDSVQRNAI